ncbi:MAG: translational GTPase TypA [Candidatus Niyogibacteria bacterium CG10_big_fil_rev_8_21_14_0_10_46_36]|uniref:50S ribosomal subunit assembly factor BipA n=1 Tax=Candidatus Niyogibacteria bacterium CG10_big_fil_rev_8_21_14_0_10_46_36 TaxID=1974726 RepID=A0A2H0TCZ9_9BACT|nr:MAG: translational GTPase TypA [Candidatus Niyogibacteria bacterium CG10_big_fil_rev_8_21_14_0_10_46_36]
MNNQEIRNIAIIAHVDHGKTTLTDALMRQTGAVEAGVSMDSNSLEQERGITIYAKNASVTYKGTKLNIVDTPGHADFGSEVERVLRSIDAVLLVVDAQEGPMPQTRFVLKKSLELGLKPIVVINKIDKPAADPNWCEEQVLELFLELGANDGQANFKVVYTIGREGVAKKSLADDMKDLTPLLDTILETVPPATSYKEGDALKAQVFNLGYDNFTGRLAVARIYEGKVTDGARIFIKQKGGETRAAKVAKISTFTGLQQVATPEAFAGDIVLIAGLGDIMIGDTLTTDENASALPAIAIDEPTISLDFMPNTSPFAGREGKFVTSRQLSDRLKKELEINVGLHVDFAETDKFRVYGRGEMHIAILLENMRREGYEVSVSQPQVIIRQNEEGKKEEPFEEVIVDTPSEFQGVIIERLSNRAFIMQNMITENNQVRLIFEGPTRGLLGYRGQFVIDTKGEGILCSRVTGFKPFAGDIKKRATGSMVSMASGKALGFSLWNLQERGTLYIGHGEEVYEGMVIGSTSKGHDMEVNPTKGKQLTNVRSSGSDEAITLTPHQVLTIENGLEVMTDDEFLEVTPKSVRLRKSKLKAIDRVKHRRDAE